MAAQCRSHKAICSWISSGSSGFERPHARMVTCRRSPSLVSQTASPVPPLDWLAVSFPASPERRLSYNALAAAEGWIPTSSNNVRSKLSYWRKAALGDVVGQAHTRILQARRSNSPRRRARPRRRPRGGTARRRETPSAVVRKDLVPGRSRKRPRRSPATVARSRSRPIATQTATPRSPSSGATGRSYRRAPESHGLFRTESEERRTTSSAPVVLEAGREVAMPPDRAQGGAGDRRSRSSGGGGVRRRRGRSPRRRRRPRR